MYLPYINGCSSIVHLLVQYPRTILVLGILSTVGLQISPVGPGPHWGSASILDREEKRIVREMPEMDKLHFQALKAFEQVKFSKIEPKEIEQVLDNCDECTDVTIDTVISDDNLLEKVKFLYFLDILHQTKDIEAAKKALIQ